MAVSIILKTSKSLNDSLDIEQFNYFLAIQIKISFLKIYFREEHVAIYFGKPSAMTNFTFVLDFTVNFFAFRRLFLSLKKAFDFETLSKMVLFSFYMFSLIKFYRLGFQIPYLHFHLIY